MTNRTCETKSVFEGSASAIQVAEPRPEPPSLLRTTRASTVRPSNSTGAPAHARLKHARLRLSIRLSAANVPHIRWGAIIITAAPLRSAPCAKPQRSALSKGAEPSIEIRQAAAIDHDQAEATRRENPFGGLQHDHAGRTFRITTGGITGRMSCRIADHIDDRIFGPIIDKILRLIDRA